MPLFQIPLFQMGTSQEDKDWLKSLDLKLFKRAYQKTITLRVGLDGSVRVSCAKSCPKSEINKFLLVNKDWIEKGLSEAEAHQSKYPEKTFCEGECFFFLGKHLSLKHIHSNRVNPRMSLMNEELILDLGKAPYGEERVPDYKRATQKFFKQSGAKLLTSLVDECSQQMNLYPKKLTFRSQKSRWGSCSSAGNISLNWRLVCAPVRVARYVVVHELAHLQHQDHSKRFWGLVEEHCAEFKVCKKWLNENQFEFSFLT